MTFLPTPARDAFNSIGQDQHNVETFVRRAGMGWTEEVQYYFDRYGADILNAKNAKGETALITALKGGHVRVVKQLLEYSAQCDSPDSHATTLFDALVYCARHNKPACIPTLLESGADIDQADNEGNTALIWAAYHGCNDAMSALLAGKPYLEHKDDDGFTALLTAACWGKASCVELLIRAGADVDATDPDGLNAHGWAMDRTFPNVAQLIEELPTRIQREKEEAANLKAADIAAYHQGTTQVVKAHKGGLKLQRPSVPSPR